METDQDAAVGTTSARNGSAAPQETCAPVSRDLHEWYRWLRRDHWLRALTDRPQLANRPRFDDRPWLGWPQREDWLCAPWKTKLWWFRQDFLGTPLKHCAKGREVTRKYGDLVAQQYGIPVARQIAQQIWLRLRYSIPPDMYYAYRLFLPRLRRQAGAFIYWKMLGPLHLQLNCRACPEGVEVLRDKVRFYQWCQTHDIPTVPVLASFRDGESTPQAWRGHGAPLPRRDLFSKNAELRQGLEATRWHYAGNDHYESADGVVNQAGLLEVLRKRSSQMSLILQEYHVNHERIAGLASGGLCMIRLVTGRLPGKHSEPLIAVIRTPVGGADVGNFVSGGLAAPIEPETGRLGSALFKYPRSGPPRHAVHPDTGHPIEGFHMPRWEEIVALGAHAHETFPEMPFIGWDIAYTEQGLLIVEGNEDWGPTISQIPHGRPLTDTVYPGYYDAWMRHCLKAEA